MNLQCWISSLMILESRRAGEKNEEALDDRSPCAKNEFQGSWGDLPHEHRRFSFEATSLNKMKELPQLSWTIKFLPCTWKKTKTNHSQAKRPAHQPGIPAMFADNLPGTVQLNCDSYMFKLCFLLLLLLICPLPCFTTSSE